MMPTAISAGRLSADISTALKKITAACRRLGAEPVGATFADVVDLVRRHDATAEDFVYAHATMLTG